MTRRLAVGLFFAAAFAVLYVSAVLAARQMPAEVYDPLAIGSSDVDGYEAH